MTPEIAGPDSGTTRSATTRFDAIAHGSELPGRRLEGTITPGGNALEFEARFLGPEGTAEIYQLEMPYDGLVCRTGGWDDKTFYFAHEGQPQVELTVQGLEIASSAPMAQLDSVRQALRSHRRLLAAFWGCSIAILTVVFGSLGAGLLTLIWLGRRLLETWF